VLQETLERYVDKYAGDDAIKPIKVDGEKFIERPFSLVLGEIELDTNLAFPDYTLTQTGDDRRGLYVDKLTILWSGRIDIAANYGDGHVYVVDHKTSSVAGPTFFKDFMLSQQMIGYNWALRRMLPGHKIMGTVVNAIMQRRPTKTGRALEYERAVYFHTDWHVAEWEKDVMSQVETFVHSLVTGFFPKQTKQCFNRYGQCPYHDVCTLPPTQRHLILDGNDFSNVTWSPLDAR
jgi:hypothetical protein